MSFEQNTLKEQESNLKIQNDDLKNALNEMNKIESLNMQNQLKIKELEKKVNDYETDKKQLMKENKIMQDEIHTLKEKVRHNDMNVDSFINEMGNLLETNNPLLVLNMPKSIPNNKRDK